MKFCQHFLYKVSRAESLGFKILGPFVLEGKGLALDPEVLPGSVAGQLGHGDTTHRQVPLLVAALQGKHVTGVACGGATVVWSSTVPARLKGIDQMAMHQLQTILQPPQKVSHPLARALDSYATLSSGGNVIRVVSPCLRAGLVKRPTPVGL